MTKNIDNKKVKLIEQIASINSEEELDQLLKYIKVARLNSVHGESIFTGIKKSISVDQLKQEQNFKGIDKQKFDVLINELDIQEPIEELLAMLD